MFNFARDWALAPHRGKELLDVVVDLLKADSAVAARLQAMIPTWSRPEDPKAALEFKLMSAMLNRDNYRPTTDPKSGSDALAFVCPVDLSVEAQSWQDEHAKPLRYLLLVQQCEKLLQAHNRLEENDAAYLYKLLKECEAGADSDEVSKTESTLALAATLIVLDGSGLATMPEAKERVLSIVRTAAGKIASTKQEIRNNRIGPIRDEMKFIAYAAMHLWMQNDEQAVEWEPSVIGLLTSGDDRAASVVVGIAYAHRQQLGSAWWRLLQAGVLWSGLVLLSPHPGEDEGQTWAGGLPG